MDAHHIDAYSREDLVNEIVGKLEPLKEPSSLKQVREWVDMEIDEVDLFLKRPAQNTNKRAAQNLKKRVDSLVEALAGEDDTYFDGRIRLSPRHRIISDPDHYDAHRVYRVTGWPGWLYLDRRDLLELLKEVQRGLDMYNKPASRTTLLKKRCAESAYRLVTVSSEHSPSTYDDGPVRKIAELIYGFHTGDYGADMKRACDLVVREMRAPPEEYGGGPPEF
jgi:hypothetical protein